MCDDYWMCMFGKSKKEIIDDHNEIDKGKTSRLREAYDKAHDVRKFEIELYWKRALYFWGFEAGLLLAFSTVLTRDVVHKGVWLLSLSVVGLFFTMVWRLALKGSKQWQENWEHHIDILEDEISGGLYKMVLYSDGCRCSFYSVSKVNLIVNSLFIVAWSASVVALSAAVLKSFIPEIHPRIILGFVLLLLDIMVFVFWAKEYARSNLKGKTGRVKAGVVFDYRSRS